MREHLRHAGEWIRARLSRSSAPSRALLMASLALLGLSALAWARPGWFLPRRLLAPEGFELTGTWLVHHDGHKLLFQPAGLPEPALPQRSPLTVWEDGVPLERCLSEERLLAGRGRFLHAGMWVYVTTRDGGDPSLHSYRAAVDRALLAREATACAPSWVFGTAALFHLLLAGVWAVRWPSARPRWYSWSLLAALALIGAEHLRNEWDVLRLAPDSASYLRGGSPGAFRPPGYPLFIAVTTGGAPDLLTRAGQYPRQEELRGLEGEPLLRVVRAQKLALNLSLLLLLAALLAAVPPPGVALLGLLLVHGGWLSEERDWVLSEPLAQALAFLLAGTAALLLRGGRWWLPCLAALAACLIQTRPAGAWGLLFPLGGAVLLWRRGGLRRAGAPVTGSLIVLLLLLGLPALLRRAESGARPVSIWSHSRISFALLLARPGDERLMPDRQAQEFLGLALRRLPAERARFDQGRAEPRERWEYLDVNTYQVALPVAEAMGLSARETEALFGRVAWALDIEYPRELLGIWLESLATALTRSSWLCASGAQLLGLLVGLGLLFWRAESDPRWLAGGLLAAHGGHVAIACASNMPLTRYVRATEPLVLVAAAVLLASALTRGGGRARRAQAGRAAPVPPRQEPARGSP